MKCIKRDMNQKKLADDAWRDRELCRQVASNSDSLKNRDKSAEEGNTRVTHQEAMAAGKSRRKPQASDFLGLSICLDEAEGLMWSSRIGGSLEDAEAHKYNQSLWQLLCRL